MSNALNVAITICMKLKVDFNRQVVQVPLLVYGVIDDELEILYKHMTIERLGVFPVIYHF